jgi:hypothetical protein
VIDLNSVTETFAPRRRRVPLFVAVSEYNTLTVSNFVLENECTSVSDFVRSSLIVSLCDGDSDIVSDKEPTCELEGVNVGDAECPSDHDDVLVDTLETDPEYSCDVDSLCLMEGLDVRFVIVTRNVTV